MAPWRISFGLLLLAACLTGCVGYQLGPTNGWRAGVRSIQVNPFQNKTYEPRLVEDVTRALRARLQQEGTYTLNTSGDGDVVVDGTIVDFERDSVGYQPNDILTVRDYELRLVAHITAKERLTGRVLLDRELVGRTTIRVGANLASAERQAGPMLADDLAKKASSLIVDGSW